MGYHRQERQKLESLIEQALELDRVRRVSFVKEQTAGEARLCKRALELLAAIEESGEDFESPAGPNRTLQGERSESGAGSSLINREIGNYKITELIDHGGMGSVFTARRASGDFEQKVAVKIIRRGMDTPSNIARFRREQKILANLQHPNIAQLYDCGFTGDGLPYIIMEFVEGVPIDLYCNRHRCTVAERLELFKQVCRAIAYAHKNLIIHRDLKPSNILVTKEGHVKVVDFGISKIAGGETGRALFHTSDQPHPLSLGFAAPEQLEGDTLTTAVDTYGLGVVLYKLLVDRYPFDLHNLATREIERLVRTEPVRSPHKRFKSLKPKEQQKRMAENRRSSPRKLVSLLKGDLEAIVLKCLRKDPSERYNTAGSLLEDLERHGRNVPVRARQPRPRYITAKFLKRHRRGFATAAVFLSLLIGFASFYTHKITLERNQAELEAQKADRISGFITDIFRDNNSADGDAAMNVTDILVNAEEKMAELDQEPLMKSKLMFHIGKLHHKLGLNNKAEELLREARTIREQNEAGNSVEEADISRYLGRVHMDNYLYEEADSEFRRANRLYEKHGRTDDIKYHKNLNNMARLAAKRGELDSAKSLFQKAEEIRSNLPKEDLKEASYITYNNMGKLYEETERLESAQRLNENALELQIDTHGIRHPETYNSLQSLGTIHQRRKEYEKAYEYKEQAHTVSMGLYGPETVHTASAHNDLGLVLKKRGNYEDAEEYYRKALDIKLKSLGEDHQSTAITYNNLATLFRKKGDYERSLLYHRKSLEIRKKNLNENHPKLGLAYRNIGFMYKKKEQLDSAKVYFQKALEVYKNSYDSLHPEIAKTRYHLGNIYGIEQKWEEARLHFQNALDIQQKVLDEDHPDIIKTYFVMALVMESIDRYEEARSYYGKVLDIRKQQPSNDFTSYEKTAEAMARLFKKAGWQNEADSLVYTLEE